MMRKMRVSGKKQLEHVHGLAFINSKDLVSSTHASLHARFSLGDFTGMRDFICCL